MKILSTIQNMAAPLMEPQDEIMDMLPKLAKFSITGLFIKWGAFKAIPAEGTISYGELAAKLKADVNLITRFSWTLVSTGLLKQIGEDQVAHTRSSLIYSSLNPLSALIRVGIDSHMPSIGAMPKYFDTYGLKEPVGRYKTVLAFSEGEPQSTVWSLMNRDPDRLANFMYAMDSASLPWPVLGTYDLSWVLPVASESPDRPLVVDVGGGKGHCLKEMVKSTPGLSMSRCVLEDLPEVLDAVRESNDQELEGAKLVALDFHTEQPVKGALVYYIRRCLHDYGDPDSVDMLRHLADAMAPDSRVLILEQVLSNPPTPMASASDLLMGLIGGKERTLKNFEQIVQEAGLKVKEVFTNPGIDAAMIECVKA
ncbi:O-methyltransferase [Thozetella sp. PMI_491]|nr:O-methyltransferase [Thozetella sp. PMI_491]